MAPFMTKKQRAQMRTRRRKAMKKRKEADAAAPPGTAVDAAVGNERSGVRSDAAGGNDHQPSHPDPAAGGGKRRRSDSDDSSSSNHEHQHQQKGQSTSEEGTLNVSIPTTVRIKLPSDLSGKELKKFRKDHRRKVRKKHPGIKDDGILFVTSDDERAEEEEHEGEQEDQNDEVTESTAVAPPKKKRKTKVKSYPRINDILAAQRAAEEAERARLEREKLNDQVPAEEKARHLALDCEMVGVGSSGKKSALARVSIVDWDHAVLLDKFVTVPERVTDFRTFVSGVRARDIKTDNTSTMDLHECRNLVGTMMKDKVLVGHALRNDLQALMLDHPRRDIRDTARYPPYMRSMGRNGGKLRPRKLRDLAKERLGMVIQVKGEAHSSVDDAVAALELYKLERTRWEKELKHSGKSRKSSKHLV